MYREYKIKSSEDLYEKGPLVWMFRPYYVAIKSKEYLAHELLARALEPHYLKQDVDEINAHYKSKNFNSKLRSEMDSAVLSIGINNADEMWIEMDNATNKILMKYINRKESLWLRFMKKLQSMTKSEG